MWKKFSIFIIIGFLLIPNIDGAMIISSGRTFYSYPFNICCCNPQIQNITMGYFFAKTPLAYDGADLGSYDGANAICRSFFNSSHVCTVEEILQTIINKNVSTIAEWNETAWIIGGPPGYIATANDCRGFTSRINTDLGRFWDFKDTTPNGMGWLTNCAQKKKLACCKQW